MKEQCAKKLKGRKCYGHLGGELGEHLFMKLIEMEWLKLEEGKSTVYEITEKGHAEFEKLYKSHKEDYTD